MVIRRSSAEPDKTLRKPLGKVLVTIEDLEALMELLGAHEAVTDEVVVQCDDGVFTEAEDMRKLSDQTLADLRIEVNGLVVHLGRDRAMAVGPPQLVDYVERAWARSRQTKIRPVGRSVGIPKFVWVFCAVATLWGIATLVVVGVTGEDPGFGFPKIDPQVGVPAVLILGVAMWWTFLTQQRQMVNRATWATIKPLSRQELRDQETQKTLVPLWALVTSILAFLALLIFNLLNYVWPRGN